MFHDIRCSPKAATQNDSHTKKGVDHDAPKLRRKRGSILATMLTSLGRPGATHGIFVAMNCIR